MGFFNQIKGPVAQVVNQILNDPDLGAEVSYNLFSGQTFSETHGHNIDSYVEYQARAVQLKHSQKSILAMESQRGMLDTPNVEAGDPMFLFRYADLPDGISLKDQIQDNNGNRMRVKAINKIFGLAIAVSCEGSSLP